MDLFLLRTKGDSASIRFVVSCHGAIGRTLETQFVAGLIHHLTWREMETFSFDYRFGLDSSAAKSKARSKNNFPIEDKRRPF